MRNGIGPWLATAAALATLALAFLGWSDRLPTEYLGVERSLEAAFQAVKTLMLDSADQSRNWEGDWRLQTARWLGLLATSFALIGIVSAVFKRQWRRWLAAWRRGHALVLGDDPFAGQFARRWAQSGRRATLHLSNVDAEADDVLVVERPGSLASRFLQNSIRHADRIVVAEADEGLTAETALWLAREHAETPVFALVRDPWLAERLNQAVESTEAGDARPGLLTAISESVAAARSVLAAHPPFLQASVAGLDRTHVLVVGLGHTGEALTADLLNAGLVKPGQPPAITIIDPRASILKQAFQARHPGLFADPGSGIDIAFLDADPAALTGEALAALVARARSLPICAAWVTEHAGAPPLAAAVALRDAAEREDLFSGPIFVQSRQGVGLMARPGGPVAGARTLVAFGSWEQTMAASGVLEPWPDRVARAYHQAYRAQAPGSTADRPWEQLPERFRVSNRRVIAHVPAKLHSVGFDLGAWLAQAGGPPLDLPTLAPGQRLFRNASELLALAELEHDRWIMDRRLEGWRHGKTRDDRRRTHPDMVAFSDLTPQAQARDVSLMIWLDGWLYRRPDGLARPRDATPPRDTARARALVARLAPHVRFDAEPTA